jgi:TRAP-type C4-dicarboxylate transport system permease small subunit
MQICAMTDTSLTPDYSPRSALPRLERMLYRLSLAAAIVGGLIVVGLAVMLVVSIASRKLFLWQVSGDYEIVEMASALAVSLLFPWCQVAGGNVAVDLLTARLPGRWNAALDRIGSALLGAVILVLVWRTGVLALSTLKIGAFSATLAWPVWIWQALMLPGLLLTAANAFFTALVPGALATRNALADSLESIE